MEELDLKELSSILWRKKFIILIIVLIFAVLGIIYSYKVITPDYKASTTLILGRINASSSDVLSQGGGQDTNQITQSEITINSNLVSTYSELIKSKSLTQKVKDNLKIHIDDKEFRKNINVSRIAETELIEITVTNRDGKLAADIANEIAKVFSEKIEEIYNISNVYIIDRAVETDIPYNINHFKDILIFIVLGIIISLGYIIIYSMLDTTIKSSEDIEKDIGVKTLISIPVRKENKKENYLNELITYSDAKSINSEVFKTLRTNVQFSNINNKENKVMLITSCFSSEGKSYISANLATAFAQAGKKVVLIDADMRRGRQARIFKLPNELGLSNYLSNLDNNGMEINERINKYINETEIKNLNIITSGNIPPNPSELLTSNKLPELIRELSIFYDLIIFDGAPVLPIADSLILTRMANSTILVSLYNKTKKDELLKAKKDIQNVGGRIIGAVLNKVPNSNYEYENKYYYGKDEEEKIRKTNKKVKKNKESIKSKVEKIAKKLKTKIDEKLKNRIKNKIKLLAPGIENTNVLDDDKSIKEYEEELKRLENEKKEKIKREQLKKKKEQEKIEEEKQKIREELVKNKEAEIINKNNEKIKEELKRKEDFESEKKKIEEAKKKNQKELEKRKKEEQKEQELLEEERIKQQELKIKQEEARRKKIEEEKAKIEKRKKELKENFRQNMDKVKQNLEEVKVKLKEKKDEFIKKITEIREENKIKYEKNKKIREEEKLKKKEFKEEKEKAEKEKRAREAEENEIRRKRELEEKEKIRLIREEERKEKDRELENERQIKLEKKLEEKVKRNQAKEEKRKFREQEKQRQKEEERIKEQILEDNLYPKTKYNKDL